MSSYVERPRRARRARRRWAARRSATRSTGASSSQVTPARRAASIRSGVVLLGDAAHAMHPDMAQGAAQSLEDAVVLAAALAESGGDVSAALARYDEQRRPRTQTIVKQARTKGLGSTSGNAAGYYLRTLAVRLVPSTRWPALAAKALAPVWDWTPPRLPR